LSEIVDRGAVVEHRVTFDGAGTQHHRAELTRMCPNLGMGVKIISSARLGTTTRLLESDRAASRRRPP
jgi:hypothetical protein